MVDERRQSIKNILEESRLPVKGKDLADEFGVTRQVIVQDIAVLRAHGAPIIATPRGYFFNQEDGKTNKFQRYFPCKHDLDGMEKELDIIVGLGGKVLDVSVEHPVYGDLKGVLMIENSKEVKSFVESIKNSNAEPLSVLTKGVHIHTVEAKSYEVLDKIEEELKKEKFLI